MWAILVAAGSGSRMSAEMPKQYLTLAGKTLLEHSIHMLESSSSVSGLMVVLAKSDDYWDSHNIRCEKPMRTVTGGAERADSVLAGLQALSDVCGDDDWVLVHDAARPCLDPAQIELMESSLLGHACGGLLAVPVKDTLKRANEAGDSVGTVAREQLWQAQTPQIFRYKLLVEAYRHAISKGILVTDESMAMEFSGHQPKLIEGRADNIKITVPEDLALAEFLMNKRVATLQVKSS